MIDRDEDLEADTLLRIARVAQEPSFPITIQTRLDHVEETGGPDGEGATTAVQAFVEAHDEYVDAPAWTIIGLNLLAAELEHGNIAPATAVDVRLIVEDAMCHAAHAAHLMNGAIARLQASV